MQIQRYMSKKVAGLGLAVAVALGGGGAAFAYFTSSGSGVGSASTAAASSVTISQIAPVYDSTISPLPNSIPSVGVEAYYYDEIGNEVTSLREDVLVTPP